jgi:hypothetical protein
MNFVTARTAIAAERTVATVTAAARALWRIIRGALLTILAIFEPLVRIVCIGAMLLGLLVAIFIKVSAIGPRFPLAFMVACSLSLGVAYFLYYGLIGLLLRE